MGTKKTINVIMRNPEIWEEFKEFVVNKRGTKHGIGIELENALRKYIDQSKFTLPGKGKHTHTHKSKTKLVTKDLQIAYANGGEPEARGFSDFNEPGISPSERTKRKIVRHLEENGMMEAESISENAVRIIIGRIAGHDKRTVDTLARSKKKLSPLILDPNCVPGILL